MASSLITLGWLTQQEARRPIWLPFASIGTLFKGREMQHPRSIAVTWQATLDQLGDDDRRLLDLLAWFGPEPVPTSILSASALSQCFNEDADRTETPETPEKEGETWDEERLEAALANLADYSMLRWEAETVTVHRVVQEMLRSRQDEQACRPAAAELDTGLRPSDNRALCPTPVCQRLSPVPQEFADVLDAADGS